MAGAWTRDEVELIVADYFAMLKAELAGRPVNKRNHNRILQRQLRGRSAGSIEFKHGNITAALLNIGHYPHIGGYKPRSNYQRLLEQVVQEYLDQEADMLQQATSGPVLSPRRAGDTDFTRLDTLLEAPPKPDGDTGIHAGRLATKPGAVVRKIDFVERDAENRRLGQMGEEWVHEFEARRLTDAECRPDLARKIIWVSQVEGDGAGYDIRSFNPDATPRLIEVKTTGLGKYFPFSVTPNELSVSVDQAERYHLYRVFTFATSPRVYVLQGALSSVCRLEPSRYSARVARA